MTLSERATAVEGAVTYATSVCPATVSCPGEKRRLRTARRPYAHPGAWRLRAPVAAPIPIQSGRGRARRSRRRSAPSLARTTGTPERRERTGSACLSRVPPPAAARPGPAARPRPEVRGQRRKGRRRKPLRGTVPRRGRLWWIRGRGPHDGGLGSGSELRCRGGDSRPGEPADGRQPGLQGHQAQIAGPGHRQGCGGPEPVPGWHGLGLRKRDRPAHREREALFHHGAVWARQPEAPVRCGLGPGRGLLHPLLPPVEGKDVSWGSQSLALPGVQGSSKPPAKYCFEMAAVV